MDSNFIGNQNNILFTDKAIKIAILYNIQKYYDKIKLSNVVIENIKYKYFAEKLFPELFFSSTEIIGKNNFFFNICRTIKNQNVFIDYIDKYDYIYSKRLCLVPWYDYNHPLITFYYNDNNYLKLKKYKNFINNFSKYKRANYNWDLIIENKIMRKYYPYYNNNYKYNNYINYIKYINYINSIQYISHIQNMEKGFKNTVENMHNDYLNKINNIDCPKCEDKSTCDCPKCNSCPTCSTCPTQVCSDCDDKIKKILDLFDDNIGQINTIMQ
jgi:hypothetical protein